MVDPQLLEIPVDLAIQRLEEEARGETELGRQHYSEAYWKIRHTGLSMRESLQVFLGAKTIFEELHSGDIDE